MGSLTSANIANEQVEGTVVALDNSHIVIEGLDFGINGKYIFVAEENNYRAKRKVDSKMKILRLPNSCTFDKNCADDTMHKLFNNSLKLAYEQFEENMDLSSIEDDMEEQHAGKQDIVLQYVILKRN